MPGQVDIYVRPVPSPDAMETFACRLVEQVWRRGHAVLVLAESDAAARRLDDRLWTFRDESFVPHRRIDANAPPTGRTMDAPAVMDAPVIVGVPGTWGGALDVLVNLTADVPDEATRAARIAEVVPGHGAGRDAGRRRYREYRDRGFEIRIHR